MELWENITPTTLSWMGILTHTSRQTKNMIHLHEKAVVRREGRSENPRHWLRTDSGHSVVIMVATFLEEKVPRQQDGERPGFLEPRAGYSK